VIVLAFSHNPSAEIILPAFCHRVFVPSVPSTFPVFPVCVGKKVFSASFAVTCPVPPAAIGRVPAVSVEADVEYKALLAPASSDSAVIV